MPVPFVEDAFFFPFYNFRFFVKSQMFMGVWINVRVFNLIPLVHLSVLLPVPSCFHYCSFSYIIELDVRDADISRSSFIVQYYFCSSRFFIFPYEVECCSFKVCEELYWGLYGNCIESVDCFWEDCHFNYVDSYLSKVMGDLSIF